MNSYKTIFFRYITAATLIFSTTQLARAQKLTNYVDPLIGSGGHGHVFVGANVPFGAVQVGPNNIFKGWDWCSGYNYSDSLIIGFSHLHLSGTGIGDLGDISVMPYTGAVKTNKGTQQDHRSGYSSLFSHRTEKVKAGYYSVTLADYNIDAELTATERVGYHRYKFHNAKDAHIIIDLQEGLNDKSTETYIEQTDAYTLKGYRYSSGWAKRQQAYFAVKFSQPIQRFQVYEGASLQTGKQFKGTATKGLISFDTSPDLVEFKVGISPVSADNALANITAEIPEWDFPKIVKQADDKWNAELSKVGIKTENEAEKRVFYTALYHAMMHPSLFNDHNGDYWGADQKPHTSAGFDNYTIFSTWDTYRAAHPLYTLLNADRMNDIVKTMLMIYDQQGYLPVWHLNGYDTGTMVGISSMQIIAEAYLKGYRGFDAEKAYQAVRNTAMSDMRGLNYLKKFQPVPSDVGIGRPVANALELSVADGSIAAFAKALGKTEDYAYFKKRAQNYKLYYDKSVGFFRGKMADGTWNPNFNPLKSEKPYGLDYAEGNAWQYRWLVPQDVIGLINLLGGQEAFIKKLDQFFTIPPAGDLVDLTGNIGQYAHGNEPGHHIPYLYAYAGEQWKTAEKVSFIMKEFYHDRPDGIIGNEDCGQMSAWYVFSSLGFYPVFPASGNYVIGSPLFKKATIQLSKQKTFTVETVKPSSQSIYVDRIELNNKPYSRSYIRHQDIISGGNMKVYMSDKPNRNFGKAVANRPR
ncbi:GH92 family glycosyl hydrolase [Mucilaginibacter sp. PAMB04168]|uniref:GH92 family glycosyl hydrolase n=1 Tax=Mucilaginibacter sp. PAMB04168 TaxID=3138567 RepID=UPI0031F6191E